MLASAAPSAPVAESDPTSDVEGFDTLYKLIILTVHGFGLFVHPDQVFNIGIKKNPNK